MKDANDLLEQETIDLNSKIFAANQKLSDQEKIQSESNAKAADF